MGLWLIIVGFPQGHISDALGFLMQRLLLAPLSPLKHPCGSLPKLLRRQGWLFVTDEHVWCTATHHDRVYADQAEPAAKS